MSVLKNVLSQWYRYLLWALMSVFFWGWIFGLLTDARPEKKLVLCVDRPEIAEEALSEELERRRPEGIKLVAAHSFDYYIFDTEELRLADLYIVGENEGLRPARLRPGGGRGRRRLVRPLRLGGGAAAALLSLLRRGIAAPGGREGPPPGGGPA